MARNWKADRKLQLKCSLFPAPLCLFALLFSFSMCKQFSSIFAQEIVSSISKSTLFLKTSFYSQLPKNSKSHFKNSDCPSEINHLYQNVRFTRLFFQFTGLRKSSENGKWADSLKWNVGWKGRKSIFSKDS